MARRNSGKRAVTSSTQENSNQLGFFDEEKVQIEKEKAPPKEKARCDCGATFTRSSRYRLRSFVAAPERLECEHCALKAWKALCEKALEKREAGNDGILL